MKLVLVAVRTEGLLEVMYRIATLWERNQRENARDQGIEQESAGMSVSEMNSAILGKYSFVRNTAYVR